MTLVGNNSALIPREANPVVSSTMISVASHGSGGGHNHLRDTLISMRQSSQEVVQQQQIQTSVLIRQQWREAQDPDRFMGSIARPTIVARNSEGSGGFFGSVFRSAGNFFKGIATTAVNRFTGLFCDENGKFSPWKTLKTVAIGAAIIGGAALLTAATGGAALPLLGMTAGNALLGGLAVGAAAYSGASLLGNAGSMASDYYNGNYERAEETAFEAGGNTFDLALSVAPAASTVRTVAGAVRAQRAAQIVSAIEAGNNAATAARAATLATNATATAAELNTAARTAQVAARTEAASLQNLVFNRSNWLPAGTSLSSMRTNLVTTGGFAGGTRANGLLNGYQRTPGVWFSRTRAAYGVVSPTVTPFVSNGATLAAANPLASISAVTRNTTPTVSEINNPFASQNLGFTMDQNQAHQLEHASAHAAHGGQVTQAGAGTQQPRLTSEQLATGVSFV